MELNFEDDDYRPAIRALLKTISNKKPTLETLDAAVAQTVQKLAIPCVDAGLLPSQLRNEDVLRVFTKDLAEMYRNEVGVRLVSGKILGRPDHEPWLQKALDEKRVVFKSYDLYRQRLQDNGFSPQSLAAIDRTTSDILEYMGDPKSAGVWKTYGLLMGDVQSGKTATFTGICHKAVDAGYKIIIVLTGTKTSLRNQTQSRLDEDLTGMTIDSKGNRGVTFKNSDVSWNLLTTIESDFTAQMRDNAFIRPDDPKEVSIAVLQKNAKVLANFLNWLEKEKALGVENLPLLLVDDEADAASVNTGKPTSSPTQINNLIRSILEKFNRAAYLAVTATPFANVFIDPQIDEETGEIRQEELPDLFPRDYIYAIPTPKGYVGVERLFGELADIEENSFKYRTLIPVSLEEDVDDAEEAKVVAGNVRINDRLEKLPPSLRKAVLYFVCVCTFKDMDYRQTNTSMLIHFVRYKDVQKGVQELVADLVEELRRFAKVESKRVTPETLANSYYKELEELWDNGCGDELWYVDPTHGARPPTMRELTKMEWRDVWRSRFVTAIEDVLVVEANANSPMKNFAGYYENNKAKLIVVGGDALSRGLTLEGLAVSYFFRRSFAYDSLLQMGRWFGYKEGMRGYMKIWISDSLIEAYRYIAEALAEFRETVETMRRQHRRPSDFGLRIRRAPNFVKLMVTAANKRRTAKRVRAMIDITGRPFQASTLPASPRERRENMQFVSDFLRRLGAMEPRCSVESDEGGKDGRDLVWKGVPGKDVGAFLQEFKVPSWNGDIEIGSVAKKIIERNEAWMVRVVSVRAEKGKAEEDVFGLGPDARVVCSGRTMVERPSWIQQPNRGILSPGHFARHWSKAKRRQVLELYKDDPVRSASTNATRVEPWMVLEQPEESPQLLIYPLRTIDEVSEDRKEKLKGAKIFRSDEPFVSVVFGLPGDGRRSSDKVWVDYDTNRIYQMHREAGYYDWGDEE